MSAKDGVEILTNIFQAYNSYMSRVSAQPNCAAEIRHVDWRDRLYDGARNTIAGIWKATQAGLAVGIGTAVLGAGVGAGAVFWDKQVKNILPKTSEDTPLEKWITTLPKVCMVAVAAGIVSALYTGCEIGLNAIRHCAPIVSKPIFHEELNSDILDLTASIAQVKKEGGFFPNLLLYGPAGTGKTMLSKWIAENSGMNYIMISGGDLVQYVNRGMHVAEFNRLFESAKNSRSPTIFFIDEAESICTSRDQEKRQGPDALLDAFLKEVGEPSKKVMIILATNRLEDFDSAVLNRIDYKTFIGPPEFEQRKQIIEKYILQFFDEKEQQELFDDCKVNELSNKTNGFTGRSLFKLINHLANIKKGLTYKSMDSVVDRFIARDKESELRRGKTTEQPSGVTPKQLTA